MKTKLLTLICCAAVIGVHAQPVIQNGNNLPASGYKATINGASGSVAPGNGGANITWDLSSLTTNVLGDVEYMDPASTPYASTFPASNKCLQITPAGSTTHLYQYTKVSATGTEDVAVNYAGSGSGKDYSANPQSVLKFPFSYGDTFTDAFISNGSQSSVVITYDGYGTLKTPFGNFANVARIKKEYGPGDYSYAWYTLNPLIIRANYDAQKNSYTLVGNGATGITEATQKLAVTVFPNPVNDKATLSIGGLPQINGLTFTLVNVCGQKVKQLPVNSATVTFEKAGLPAGMYFYQLSTAETILATGKISIE